MKIIKGMTAEAIVITAEVEAAFLKVTNWAHDDREKDPKALALKCQLLTGDSEGWHFVLTGFEVASQGFPAGSIGWDGAVRNATKGEVLMLTREQAERMGAAALEKIVKN